MKAHVVTVRLLVTDEVVEDVWSPNAAAYVRDLMLRVVNDGEIWGSEIVSANVVDLPPGFHARTHTIGSLEPT